MGISFDFMSKVGLRSAGRASVDEVLDLVPELALRWHAADAGLDPCSIEGDFNFTLADHDVFPDLVRAWWEERTGLVYIAHGSTRIVFDLGDGLVIKIALDPMGEEANVGEMDTWFSLCESGLSVFFVPVEAGDERFLLMSKVEPLSQRRFLEPDGAEIEREWRLRRDAFRRLQPAHGVLDIDIPSNWGLLDGMVSILDYPPSY